MNEPTLQDLQSHLADYLTGKLSLSEFRDWFDVETWDIAAEPDTPIRQVTGEIELRLAEFTSGHLTEHELRNLLRVLVPDPIIDEVMDFQIPVRYGAPVEVTFS